MKTSQLSVKERTERIRKVIRYGEKQLLKRYPILAYQDQIGAAIFFFSIGGMILTSYFYIDGSLGAIPTIILNMLFTSFLHELEHDIIHSQYYSKHPFEDVMKWGVNIFRGNQPHTQCRRKMHIFHHKVSGQDNDTEELWVGNGMKWSWRRLIVCLDIPLGTFLYFEHLRKKKPELNDVVDVSIKSWFVVFIFTSLLYLSLIYYAIMGVNHLLDLGLTVPVLLQPTIKILEILSVIWLFPSAIRLAMLTFITSNMHYHGDVPKGDIGMIYQTQVLDAWYFLPFNFFNFNFGSTHGIHHFVVNQPFYIRQMVAPLAHAAFKKYGVRFNDIGTFKRANRYSVEYVPQS